MSKLYDRAKMTVSNTPGTGAFMLGLPVLNYLSFAAAGVGDGERVPYVAEEVGVGWECGYGTYSAATTSLTRNTVEKSSASGNLSLVSFTPAVKVWIDVLASGLIHEGLATATFNPVSTMIPCLQGGELRLTSLSGGAKLPTVDDYGASVNASAAVNKLAFQALVDATPDSGLRFGIVPGGSWDGDFATLTYGTRRFVWLHMGLVRYLGTAPTTNLAFVDYTDGGTRRPGFQGSWLFAKDTEGIPTAADHDKATPNLMIKRDENSPSTDASGTAFNITHNVNAAAKGNIFGQLIDATVAATALAGTYTGKYINITRSVPNAVGTAATILGQNITMLETTFKGSTNSDGPFVCMELQVRTSGPDDNGSGIRYGFSVNSVDAGPSADGAQYIRTGFRLKNNNPSGATTPGSYKYGIEFDIDDTAAAGGLWTGIYLPTFRDIGIDMSGQGSAAGKYAAKLSKATQLGGVEVLYDARMRTAFVDQLFVRGGDGANLILRSEEFDNASWSKPAAALTVSADFGVSPGGLTSADKLIPSVANTAAHDASQSISFTSGQAYTFSCYLKASGYNCCALQLPTAAFPGNERIIFDLANGGFRVDSGSTATANMSPVGNGWWRCQITATADATVSSTVTVRPFSTLAGTSFAGSPSTGLGVLAWGAQVRQSSTPGPYTRTAGSAATNGAGCVYLMEVTAPPSPPTKGIALYAISSGGKTKAMALFATGAAVVMASEP